jgi:DNA-binding transcriptional LysR family regulator
MTRDLDVSLLRAFAAVVDSGSVTNAARLLNRTQAAVSLQIKRLEDEFGQDLFLREHRKLTLAPSGEKLLGPARALLRLNDELWGQMTTPAFEGEVRLGVPVDIIAAYVPQVLKRFHAAWPRVRVTMVAKNSFDLLEDLRSGAIDVTLTTDREAGPGAEVLRSDALVWVGAKGGEAHKQTPLPISTGTRTCRFRPVVLDALRAAGRDWRIVLAISNQDAVNATISAGVTIAAMLRENVPADLVVLGLEDGLPPLPDFLINLTLPATGASDVAQALAMHIRDEFSTRFGERRRPSARAAPSRGAAA